MTKHRVFISYYHEDQIEVNNFINTFDRERKIFTYRALGALDDINLMDSTNTDYIMGRIRRDYIKDSTVTIVLIGKNTWGRRYVDWEIKASLMQGQNNPNGLIGIKLPSAGRYPKIPERLELNVSSGYAKVYDYPIRKDNLENWIEEAYRNRMVKRNSITNPWEIYKYNRS